jgi:hypothetical protein
MSSNTVMGEQKNCHLKNLNYIFFADDKKRKTKWDNQPSSNVTGSCGGLPGVINPSVVTGSASGTKSTVIPAVGNITKKTK